MSVRKRLTKHGEVRWLVDYADGAGIRRNRQFATKAEATTFAAKSKTEIIKRGSHAGQRLDHRGRGRRSYGLNRRTGESSSKARCCTIRNR